MQRSAQSVVIGLLGVALASGLGVPVPLSAQPRDEAGEVAMLQRINALRSAARLPALERSPALDAAALTHSADMAWHNRLTHVSETTGDPAARAAAAGFRAAAVGENVTRGATVDAAHHSLVDSAAHLENIMNASYTHAGVAVVRGTGSEAGGLWVTQLFAESSSLPVAQGVPVPPVPIPYRGRADPVGSPLPPGVAMPAPAPPQPPAPAVAATPPAARTWRTGGLVPAARPLVTVPGPGTGADVAGYWVYYADRWVFYPLPQDARPGQELQPDWSVQGPPPADAQSNDGGQPEPPRRRAGRRSAQGAPTFGWSPRRHYRRWRYGR